MDITRIGVLTVSDRCCRESYDDKSGDTIESFIKSGNFGEGFFVARRACIPDETTEISKKLKEWTDTDKLDLIITTGGTGFTERDVTPEATKEVIDKDASSVTLAILIESLKITPMAMLSRAVCGIRKSTLIINFPGSPKACTECLNIVKPVIKHAIDLLKNSYRIEETHKNIAKRNVTENVIIESQVNIRQIARRQRHSPYSLVKVSEAQKKILETVQKLPSVKMNMNDALGFVLYSDVFAKEPFPPFRASMKDGYAVISRDGSGERSVISSSVAGFSTSNCVIKPGECMRITTGAPVPEGADAVVQVEDTDLLKESEDGESELIVSILTDPIARQNIREIGSDIEENSIIGRSGTLLTSSELGVLATAGVCEVMVIRKPRIAVLSTGNELLSPDAVLEPGKIRDSNKTTLMALLKENGFAGVDCGIALDDPNILLDKIRSSLVDNDVLITSGGVSMGERDLIADVLLKDLNAKIHFGRVNMKPGKPTKFFTISTLTKTKYVFALPGNPVSAAVTCHLFVFPALRAMSGLHKPLPMLFKVKLSADVKLDSRYEYARASLRQDDEDIVPRAFITGNQLSCRMMNMVSADCLLHLPAATEERKILTAGTIVNAQLIRRL